MGFPRLILIPATFLRHPYIEKYRGDLKNMDPLASFLNFLVLVYTPSQPMSIWWIISP